MLHRTSVALILTLVLGLALIAAAPTAAQNGQYIDLRLEKLVDGLDNPVQMVDPNDGTGRFFIVEKPGKILILKDGKVADQPFLDIANQVSTGSEQGLLSMALHPDFAKNGEFFIDYTDAKGNTQVERWNVSKTDANAADPSSKKTILTVQQPYSNHNGGLLLFGPDGMLYIGLGDGGSEGDPLHNGQNLDTLLSKILRVDVDTTTGDLAYGIPKDNPFVNKSDTRPETWVWGLRNPWRFSFDKKTGDLLIGDVGQDEYEEADLAPAGKGGFNFGWSTMEADSCYKASSCDQQGLTKPFFFYSHQDGGCSITGGYVYRGSKIQGLDGTYLAADYCSGLLWQVHPDGKGGWTVDEPISTGTTPSSFAEDASGELYLIDLQGAIYKIIA